MRITRFMFGCATLISLSVLIVACKAPVTAQNRSTQNASMSEIEAGRYLTNAGNCISCHTKKDGKPFAGGFPVRTPFGVVYSPNITPDKETGIGNWSEQEFYDAMHLGKDNEGKHLYPAFPYPWYTKVSRADVDAIKAYLDSLTPVKQQNITDTLDWPVSWRGSMIAWNMLYFTAGSFKPDPKKSAQYNRGAYLVEGLGHCAQCHSPKNMLGAVENGDKRLSGGYADSREHWFAPSLSDNLRQGIGDWSVLEIVDYLKTASNDKSASAGPMTGVVMNSTRYLNDADLTAIAVYLKDMPQMQTTSETKTTDLSVQTLASGHDLYVHNCASCHMADGNGLLHYFPPLKGSAAIQAENPGTVINVVLAGASITVPSSKPTGLLMPAFGQKLSDQEIADVVNYIRNSWGNRAPTVRTNTVSEIRKSSQAPATNKSHKPTANHR